MNNRGSVPGQMRMPVGYSQPAPTQQPGRAAANRLPNGNKMATAGWAFGGGPMGAAGMPAPRQMGNVSFAQTAAASQQSNQLDPSDFPSLSNVQLHNQSQAALWGTGPGTRSNGGLVGRGQTATLASHLAQPPQSEDPYSQANTSRSHAVAQGSFRYGSNGNMNVGQQQMAPSSIDEFPPLNREASQGPNISFQNIGAPSASIGSQNGPNAQNMGPIAQNSQSVQNNQNAQSVPASQVAQNRNGNGLLNALSASNASRAAASPVTNGAPGLPAPVARPQEQRPSLSEEVESVAAAAESRKPLGAIGNDQKSTVPDDSLAIGTNASGLPILDPLGGMPDVDKWGLKGLITLMDKYPDYHAMVSGIDVNNLGLDLMATDMISTQNYSLFDDVLPRPPTPKFRLPDCYHVTNTQPIEQVVHSFNDESLFYMFYSMPGDIRQHVAAQELNNRNWRWHKRLQLWITKDETMVAQTISINEERGYYIVWDTNSWRKDQREIILAYNELETTTPPIAPRT